MSFYWPQVFWLMFLPAGLLAWDFARRRAAAANGHPKILRAEAGTHSLQLSTSQPSAHRARPRVWLCAGLALAVVALARPQWGRLEEPVFDQSREILLALDLSRSMRAQDVRPSRLARAKLLIQSLLDRLRGERVGLIVFSGTAFLQSPLSTDYEILREFLPSLDPDFLPEGGTNYRALLETALDAFNASGSADRYLIILSDGEATDDDWKPLVDDLKRKNIRVIGLGVGTAVGAMIPDNAGSFVKDERGAVILSKLESSTLHDLASQTGGAYTDASAWVDLPALLAKTIETGRRGEFREENQVRLVERFQWALAPALLCLLISFWREFPVQPRVRDVRFSEDKNQETRDKAQKAAAPTSAHLSSVICLLISVFCLRARASDETAFAAPLSNLVGHLSAQNTHTAHDWADLARATITFGQRLQTTQQPVPAGPIRDGLDAVEAGQKLDAKAANWPELRQKLEALQKKSEKQKPPPQQNQSPQPQKNESDKNRQNQSKKEQQNPSNQSKQPRQNKRQKSASSQNQNNENKNQSSAGPSAFG
ncbi:MAG: VWA domain-containing protein, partial [Verrucomicrobiota bacterium]|nr:VWA domain-containing protein [Verrucomicrobiota bacterium]